MTGSDVLRTCEPLRELPTSLPPSRSTIRLFFFFRPRATIAGEAVSELGADPTGDPPGLVRAGTISAPAFGEGLPTGTTGGDGAAVGVARADAICSGGGDVKYRFS